MGDSLSKKTWLPTRKWAAALVTALIGWAIAFVNVGVWTATLKIGLITIIGQAIVSWLVPNLDTPGGVPYKLSPRSRQRGYVRNDLVAVVVIVVVAAICVHFFGWIGLLVLLLLLLLLR